MRRNFYLAIAVAILAAGAAQAKMPFVKKAQELGFKVENCQSCHVDKMPKKDAKGEPYGPMGKFLIEKKAEKKAAEIDLNWLKDYKAK